MLLNFCKYCLKKSTILLSLFFCCSLTNCHIWLHNVWLLIQCKWGSIVNKGSFFPELALVPAPAPTPCWWQMGIYIISSVGGLQHKGGQEQRVVGSQAWRQTWVMGSCMSVKTVGKQRGKQHHGSRITVPVYKNHSCSKHRSLCWPPRVSRTVWKIWGLLHLLAHFWCLHPVNGLLTQNRLDSYRVAHEDLAWEALAEGGTKTFSAINPLNIIYWWTSQFIKIRSCPRNILPKYYSKNQGLIHIPIVRCTI